MKLKPIGNRVLIQELVEDESADGVFIPESARERSGAGIVRAVGPAVKNPLLVPGVTALLPKYEGTKIKVDGVQHLLVKEEEILGVLNV